MPQHPSVREHRDRGLAPTFRRCAHQRRSDGDADVQSSGELPLSPLCSVRKRSRSCSSAARVRRSTSFSGVLLSQAGHTRHASGPALPGPPTPRSCVRRRRTFGTSSRRVLRGRRIPLARLAVSAPSRSPLSQALPGTERVQDSNTLQGIEPDGSKAGTECGCPRRTAFRTDRSARVAGL